jgi:hypothetical protein
VVAEDWRAFTRPGPGSRTPWPRHLTLLGAGLLGPNGGGGPKQMIHRRDAADVSCPPLTSQCRLGRRSYLQPLCPCPRGGGPGGGAGGHADNLGASNRRIRDLDPAMVVPAAGLANRDAALVEGRQRGQIHQPQPCVVVECRDALGRIRDSGTKDSPVIPFTRTSSSSQDRSVPGPRWILPMSFEPVN